LAAVFPTDRRHFIWQQGAYLHAKNVYLLHSFPLFLLDFLFFSLFILLLVFKNANAAPLAVR